MINIKIWKKNTFTVTCLHVIKILFNNWNMLTFPFLFLLMGNNVGKTVVVSTPSSSKEEFQFIIKKMKLQNTKNWKNRMMKKNRRCVHILLLERSCERYSMLVTSVGWTLEDGIWTGASGGRCVYTLYIHIYTLCIYLWFIINFVTQNG